MEASNNSLSMTTIWWIIGIFSTVVVGGGGAWMTAVNSKLMKVDVLEIKVENTQYRLTRIEDKLDVVIDRLPNKAK
jgi:hypothetical protein